MIEISFVAPEVTDTARVITGKLIDGSALKPGMVVTLDLPAK